MCRGRTAALFENFLLDHNIISTLFGFIIYLPLMIILFMLFVAQSILSIILYLVGQICTCGCCTLKKIKNERKSTMRSRGDMNNVNNESCSVSILQYNTFTYFGRYWTRKPLMEHLIKSLSPDIISINEAIRSRVWSFGTINMINNIFKKYGKCDGFISSPYDNIKTNIKFLFKHSYIWDYIIAEIQLLLNIYFILPFLRGCLWKAALKGGNACVDFGLLFSGAPLHFGNALIFTNTIMYNKQFLTLPGVRTVNRCLYIHPKNNNKKLWIVNTHLTAQAQSKFNVQKQQLEQCEIIFKWMEDIECDADGIIICGDFNSTPNSETYSIMKQNGYESCGCKIMGKNKYCTYESLTWTYGDGIDDDVGQILTMDYIWLKKLKNNININIEQCSIVGKKYVKSNHQNKNIKIFPSDHYGVYVKLSW